MVIRWRVFLLSLLLLSLWVNMAAALTMQAVADRDRIAAGESLQLQLRIDGSPDDDPDLTPLQQNWEILSRSQSSQMQIINGSFSRSVVYTLTLMPRSQGALMIPSICIAEGCSQPITIEVSDASAQSGKIDQPLLLETEISSRKIVSQGQLLLSVRLLRRVDLLEGQLSEPQPTGVETVVKKLGEDRSYETRRNGLLYQVFERNYAIFPQGSGQLQIPALQFDGSITSGRSRFDPYARQGRRVRRNSQPIEVEVTELPADLGRRPWLPASALKLEDDWQEQPPSLVVGEPATRTLRLSASGLAAVKLPELTPAIPDSFKNYLDQPSREDKLDSRGIVGVLEQKIALVPTRPGRFLLPAIDLDWWDVTTGRWRQAHLDAVELEVAPAADAAPVTPAVVADADTKPSAPLQSAAQTTLDTALPVTSPALGSEQLSAGFWPWLSLSLGFAWLFTLVLLLRQRQRLTRVDEAETKTPLPDEKTARQAVIQAARQHNPQQTRRALVLWSCSLWPVMSGGEYEYLYQSAGQLLQKELKALDLCLYGGDGLSWSGQSLADCVVKWSQRPTAKEASELPELYPDDSTDQ